MSRWDWVTAALGELISLLESMRPKIIFQWCDNRQVSNNANYSERLIKLGDEPSWGLSWLRFYTAIEHIAY